MQGSQAVRVGAILAVFVLVAVAGISIGYGFGTSVQISARGATVTSTVTTSNSTEPYVLTLVIATNSVFNSTAGTMPAYFVLGPSGLQSSASIAVPAHRLIKLVIVCYDDGNATMVQNGVNQVSGTQGNTVLVENNDNINSTQGISGIVVKGGQNVSSIDPTLLAHTFSVSTLNLNIPVELSSTTVAYFTINQAGTYTWQCMTLCGGAAMDSPGWMTGSLVAQ